MAHNAELWSKAAIFLMIFVAAKVARPRMAWLRRGHLRLWRLYSSHDQLHLSEHLDIIQAFNPESTVDEVSHTVVDVLRTITIFDFAAVFVLDENGVRIVAALQKETWMGHVKAEQDIMGALNTAVVEMGRSSINAVLPFSHVFRLTSKRSTIGALVVGRKCSTVSLSEGKQALLTLLVKNAESAIANAVLMERLTHMATTDPLTGLMNRRHFNQQLDACLLQSKRNDQQISLIFTDIDHFKSINDRFGHPVGDAVLVQIGAILQSSVRRQDLVARYGGEEFAVCLNHTNQEDAWRMAERIREAVARKVFAYTKVPVRCTLSLGVVTFPENAFDTSKLIAAADEAMYQAKRAGRNQTVIFYHGR
jgi:diguanylate cyclase (GGDEF)-like protein